MDSLPAAARRPCLEAGEQVSLGLGEEIITQGDRTRHAYFPGTAVCSLTMGLKSGDKAECAIVGAEGVIGLSLLSGASRSPIAAVVQIAGSGYRMPIASFAELLQHNRPLREAILLYAGFALNVVGRSVACNSYHSIVERLARWLLMTHDRVERDELSLRAMQVIDYQRGVVRILDRKRLEQVSCECYEANRRYLQLLPWAAA
ncbi:MAG TPA: Crp/Fnr family transcriptional regulator [Burkholderiales bacterium]